jgi:hypothetical protein
MPNPQTGGGADVSKGLQKFTYALYLCDASSGGVIPTAKTVNAEPSSPWVRQGRLQGDDFTWNIAAPSYLEGRAGFTQVLKYYVVNKAEMPQMTAKLDEADPEVQNRLRGGLSGAATSLSSGAYTGYQFIYKAGLFYAAKVLLVGSAITGSRERHFFAGNAVVTFKEADDPTSEVVEVTFTFLNDASNNAFTMNEWA